MTANVDGTVTVDNPERPPESYCQNVGCEEPERIEQNVDTVIWDLMNRFAGMSFLVYPLVLTVLTLLLHSGVWLVGGERGWFPTFTVAAWGLVPTIAVIGLSLIGLWLMVDPVTISPGDDLGTALAPLEDQFRAFDPYRTAGSVLGAIWSGFIWRAGLREHQNLPNTEASLLAGLVAVLYLVGTLLL